MDSPATLLEKAWILRNQGNPKALTSVLEKLEGMITSDDYTSLGRYYHIKRQIEADRGNLIRARKWNHLSIEAYAQAENLEQQAHAVRHLADLEYELTNFEEALHRYEEAMRWYRKNGQPLDIANAKRGYALALEACQKMSKARSTWEEVRLHYKSLGITDGVKEAERHLATL